jgi:hypothetical protein
MHYERLFRFLTAIIVGFVVTYLLLILTGCDIPTEYTVQSPNCPWPPPSVLDQSISTVPLGCPYERADGTIVGGWWN